MNFSAFLRATTVVAALAFTTLAFAQVHVIDHPTDMPAPLATPNFQSTFPSAALRR